MCHILIISPGFPQELFDVFGRGQYFNQIMVDVTICGGEFMIKVLGIAGKIGASAAGFGDKEFSGGGVIRLNVDLPVAVQSSGSDVTHVQSGRACDANAAKLGFDGEEMIEVVILGGVPAAAETGSEKAFRQARAGGDPDFPAVAKSSMIHFGFKQF